MYIEFVDEGGSDYKARSIFNIKMTRVFIGIGLLITVLLSAWVLGAKEMHASQARSNVIDVTSTLMKDTEPLTDRYGSVTGLYAQVTYEVAGVEHRDGILVDNPMRVGETVALQADKRDGKLVWKGDMHVGWMSFTFIPLLLSLAVAVSMGIALMLGTWLNIRADYPLTRLWERQARVRANREVGQAQLM